MKRPNNSIIKICYKKGNYSIQTLEMGDSSIFGCIPIEVVLARTISSSGQKLFKSERDNACPPTVSASSLARSCRNRLREVQNTYK